MVFTDFGQLTDIFFRSIIAIISKYINFYLKIGFRLNRTVKMPAFEWRPVINCAVIFFEVHEEAAEW